MISGKSFLKKTVILGSYIKEDLAQGNCYRRSSLITRSACAIRLVIYNTRLTTYSSRNTRLPTRSTGLFTRGTRLSTRSTRSNICRSFYN